MLGVASMSQFPLMTTDLLHLMREAIGNVQLDFLRNLFGERILTDAMVESIAISDGGLTKQTLHEVWRMAPGRGTDGQALEGLNCVNQELEHLIRQSWGRPASSAVMPFRPC
jgi:chromosome partitioning protein